MNTVRIVNPAEPGSFFTINESDFDPSRHELFEARVHAAPTFEEYTAAGYAPEDYPPHGYEAVPSPGLDAYRAQVAEKAAADAKAIAEAEAALKGSVPAQTDTPAPAAEQVPEQVTAPAVEPDKPKAKKK